MKKRLYFLFKETIPNFLLSIFYILLFDILNIGIEIANSRFVLRFALSFTFLMYLIFNLINIFQTRLFRKFSIQDILYDKKNKILYLLLVFKCINIISSLIILYLCFNRYSDNILSNTSLTPFYIGLSIEISKIVLNRLFKFDKIITLNQSQEELNEKIEKMVQEMMKEQENPHFPSNEAYLKGKKEKDPKARNDDKDQKR